MNGEARAGFAGDEQTKLRYVCIKETFLRNAKTPKKSRFVTEVTFGDKKSRFSGICKLMLEVVYILELSGQSNSETVYSWEFPENFNSETVY